MPANPLIEHLIKGWRDIRALCIQQLDLIEGGKLRFNTNGVDITDETVATEARDLSTNTSNRLTRLLPRPDPIQLAIGFAYALSAVATA
jgi:hypothetical protein